MIWKILVPRRKAVENLEMNKNLSVIPAICNTKMT